MSGEIDPIVANYLQVATAREASEKAAAAEHEQRIQEHLAQMEPFKASFAELGQLLEKLASQINEQTKTETISVKVDAEKINFKAKEFSCRISFVIRGGIPILEFDTPVRPVEMVPERSDVVRWYCREAPQSQRNTVQALAEHVFWLEKQFHSAR